MKIKIINIISHPPAYELYSNDPRPEINWDTPDGSWVGIWGYAWADLIGKEVIKLADEFEYEVWQPDPRADRIYEYNFPEGLCHKLFPAERRHIVSGLIRKDYIISKSISQKLVLQDRDNNLILHLNTTNSGINETILDLSLSCPIILQLLGEINLPLNNLFKPQKNILSKSSYIREHSRTRKMFKKVSVVSCVNKSGENILKRYFNKKIIYLPIGVDFDVWQAQTDRKSAKRNLGLSEDKFVLLSSSRLNGLKQIDRVIHILSKLDSSYDFEYIIAGHGITQYENYLNSLGKRLMNNGKLRFVGFVSEEKLHNWYNAADLFISTSVSEGMPVSAVKAMAMEVPIMLTDTGLVASILSRHNCGAVIPRRDYKVWERELKSVLEGKNIRLMDRKIVRSLFHWPFVAQSYIKMYRDLSYSYYR